MLHNIKIKDRTADLITHYPSPERNLSVNFRTVTTKVLEIKEQLLCLIKYGKSFMQKVVYAHYLSQATSAVF